MEEKLTCTAAERRLLDLTMNGASPGQLKDARQAVVDERLTPELRRTLLGFYIDIARSAAARDKFEHEHNLQITQEVHLQLLEESNAAVAGDAESR